MDAACARCNSPMVGGGMYTSDGVLVCARCAAHATVSVANATLATAQRDAHDRETAGKIVGVAAAGFGVIGIIAAIIVFVIAAALLFAFIWVIKHLPSGSFNVG